MAIGRQKSLVFPAVGALLAFNYWLAVERPRHLNCAPGDVCHVDSSTSRFNRRMLWTSIWIYSIAVTLTYASQWWIRWQS